MLRKLVQKKNIILTGCIAIIFILWTLTMIFCDKEDKTTVLVLSVILPFIIYGFERLIFKIIRINAPLKFIQLGIYFFLIMGIFGVVTDLISFITEFPNGLSPTLTACIGLIIAALDEAKRNIDSK